VTRCRWINKAQGTRADLISLAIDGRVSSIPGMFGDRRLYIFDPLALYHIFVKVSPILSGATAIHTLVRIKPFIPRSKHLLSAFYYSQEVRHCSISFSVNNLILGPGLLSTLGSLSSPSRYDYKMNHFQASSTASSERCLILHSRLHTCAI